jgi:hypothetical protein
MDICREAMTIFTSLVADAELVEHKTGPNSTSPWVQKAITFDASPESLSLPIDEFREIIIRPVITALCASLPKKLRILKFRGINPKAEYAAQVEYENLMLRCSIQSEVGEFSILVDGKA